MKFIFATLLAVLPFVCAINYENFPNCPFAQYLLHKDSSKKSCIELATESLDQNNKTRVRNTALKLIDNKSVDNLDDNDLSTIEKAKCMEALYCYILAQVKASPGMAAIKFECSKEEDSHDGDCWANKVKKIPECDGIFNQTSLGE
ncbi:hypothetical protein CHUAL_009078 [Chamberlinius hualienensis]